MRLDQRIKKGDPIPNEPCSGPVQATASARELRACFDAPLVVTDGPTSEFSMAKPRRAASAKKTVPKTATKAATKSAPGKGPRILIVEARFYDDIADLLLSGAV